MCQQTSRAIINADFGGGNVQLAILYSVVHLREPYESKLHHTDSVSLFGESSA